MQSKRVHPYTSVHLSIADLPGPFIVGYEVSILVALTTYGNWSNHSLSGPIFSVVDMWLLSQATP